MDLRRPRLVAALACLIAAAACSQEHRPVPGAPCGASGDCASPLSCVFGQCLEACRQQGECPAPSACRLAPGAGAASSRARVCLLSPACGASFECPADLVCGRDLQCRNECQTDDDCLQGYTCVVGLLDASRRSRVCAEPAAVAPNGELRREGDAGLP